MRIYSHDIGMIFSIEKCALIRRNGKQQMTEGIKIPHQEKNRTLGEEETYEYLGIFEADTIKQVEIKEKIKKEYLKWTRKLFDVKLYNRTLIHGINTWTIPFVRYLGPFLKWTRELRQMDDAND